MRAPLQPESTLHYRMLCVQCCQRCLGVCYRSRCGRFLRTLLINHLTPIIVDPKYYRSAIQFSSFRHTALNHNLIF